MRINLKFSKYGLIKVSIALRLIFIITIFFCANCCIYAQKKSDSIIWESNVKLKWSDFQGTIPDTGKNKIHDAFTSTMINNQYYQEDDFPMYITLVYFIKKASWTKDTNSLDLLKHEQGHFDMREICARKIRKAVIELQEDYNTEINDYEYIIQKLLKESHELTLLYDNETNHGLNTINQSDWNTRIANELCGLDEFQMNKPRPLLNE